MKYNRSKNWLKGFVYYEDKNMICFSNNIVLKHNLDYVF